MKKIRWIMLLLALAPVWSKAADTAHSAKIIAVSGGVSVTTAAGAGVGTVGTVLQVGATIKTAATGEASLQLFDGVVVIVQPDTVVSLQTLSVANGKENTLLDLRSGGVIASLDPAKKNISNFQVRTPQGVAAARGTVFAVRVNQASASTVTTMSGTVTFVTDQGEITVSFGQVGQVGGAMSVADAVKANPNLAGEILAATADVAQAIGQGSITNSDQTPGLVAAVLAALVDVAVQAAPDRAADIVRDVIVAAGPALQGPDGAETVEAIATAAAQSAARAGEENDAEIAAAAKAAADSAGIEGVSDNPIDATTDSNPVLPAIDQTQAIVSPSAP